MSPLKGSLLSLFVAVAAGVCWHAGDSVAAASETDPLPAPLVLSADPPVGHRVVTLAVDGLECGGCAARVYRALTGVGFVRDAAVDAGTRLVQAVVPESVDVDVLAETVELDGMSLRPLD